MQGTDHAGDIQIQQPQQAAEEDQEGEDHKQQVVGQGRPLAAHVMDEVTLDNVPEKTPRPAVRHRSEPFEQSRFLSDIGPVRG